MIVLIPDLRLSIFFVIQIIVIEIIFKYNFILWFIRDLHSPWTSKTFALKSAKAWRKHSNILLKHTHLGMNIGILVLSGLFICNVIWKATYPLSPVYAVLEFLVSYLHEWARSPNESKKLMCIR